MLVNQLLLALPNSEFQRLAPHLEEVSLSLGQVLYEAGEKIKHVYFPNRAMVSLIAVLEDGSTTEVCMVGGNGVVGYPAFLGGEYTTTRTIVQVAGTAMKIDAKILQREFNRGGILQRRLLLYTQALLTQISQTAACNRHHSLEARLARWLLTAQDHKASDTLQITQEFISELLGTRRSGVTVAAGMLQQAGIIRYSRGRITILNRSALEATACECYSFIKKEFERLLDGENS
ncbi:MAG: Crp/Fnr family transcriptional regulator [Fischerella sp.]|nr:Crp/Fnr family transcriptional regulator [Fischerella sp.]